MADYINDSIKNGGYIKDDGTVDVSLIQGNLYDPDNAPQMATSHFMPDPQASVEPLNRDPNQSLYGPLDRY